MAVVARNSTLTCLGDQLLIRKTGDEKWRHAVVEGIPPGYVLWVLTPGRSTKLVDFSADTKKVGRNSTSEVSASGLRGHSRPERARCFQSR